MVSIKLTNREAEVALLALESEHFRLIHVQRESNDSKFKKALGDLASIARRLKTKLRAELAARKIHQ